MPPVFDAFSSYRQCAVRVSDDLSMGLSCWPFCLNKKRVAASVKDNRSCVKKTLFRAISPLTCPLLLFFRIVLCTTACYCPEKHLISLFCLKTVGYCRSKNEQFKERPLCMPTGECFLTVVNRVIHSKCGKPFSCPFQVKVKGYSAVFSRFNRADVSSRPPPWRCSSA